MRDAGRAGDEDDVRTAPQQPRQRDLPGGRIQFAGDLCDPPGSLCQRGFRSEWLGGERAPRKVRDPLLRAVVEHWIVIALEQVIAILDGGDGYDLLRFLDLRER